MFFSGLWHLGRYPVDVYTPFIRGALTYVIPVAFVSTFPALALTRGADTSVIAGGLAAAIASVAVVIAVWSAGIRRYRSATS